VETSQRYIVRESVGVPVNFAYGRGFPSVTEIMIMDSWYCYEVVWRSLGTVGWLRPPEVRAKARSLADKWTAEHNEWMRSG
jgi:hypothetical protein